MSALVWQPCFESRQAGQLPEMVGEFVRQHGLVRPGERVLVGVSGGPDSVALLHLLRRWAPHWGLGLAVAHFDHGLRGEASRQDARFVAQLAGELGLPFFLGQGATAETARVQKISLQMAARRLRLEFFRRLRGEHGFDCLALGHTADDQVELFFLRLLRGAGAEGLKGMWPRSPEGVIRPLLGVGKEVLLAWLDQEKLPYREDQSNLSRTYLRNRIRLDLLPRLQKEYNPQVRAAVWRLMALLQEDERFLAQEADHARQRVERRLTPRLAVLDLAPLLALPPALMTRVIRQCLGSLPIHQEIPLTWVQGILDLARGRRSGGRMRLGSWEVARAGSELHFFPALPDPSGPPAGVLEQPGETEAAPGWRLKASLLPPPAGNLQPDSPASAWLDADQAPFPVALRTPEPGDRFRPAGGPGQRKLKEFLVDAKIPSWLRTHLPVVLSGGRIIWLPGLRLAEGVRAGPQSRRILALTLSPGNDTTRHLWEVLLALRKHARP